jgi:hypothetical protein
MDYKNATTEELKQECRRVIAIERADPSLEAACRSLWHKAYEELFRRGEANFEL